MKQRCSNPNHRHYKSYGGKGVTVCERWNTFRNFVEDLGIRPEGTTIGRHLDQGNYEPGNAWWQTAAEQKRVGSRSSNPVLTEDNVYAIRALVDRRNSRGCSVLNMAKDLGVAHATISLILSRKTWTHI